MRKNVYIGIPTEIKPDERRVALTPSGAREFTARGHRVLVQRGAGEGSGFSDQDYAAAGADLTTVDEVFAEGELILKVKEPQPAEVERLTPQHTLFTYLHLAADPELAFALARTGARCIAYETVEDAAGRLPLLRPMSEIAGRLPLLRPMSEIAGRLSAQAGVSALTGPGGGRGLLMGGVPGVAPAKVLVLGGGVAGTAAAVVAAGMGARVTIVDRSVPRLIELEKRFGSRVRTVHASELAIQELLSTADVVIGAVLVTGARAPRLVRRDDLATMCRGSVLVDVSIDQGGCIETSRPTTHSDPTYTVDGVVHYCVTNMPGAVPATSTRALSSVTLEHALRLADLGAEAALAADPRLARGVNVEAGVIAHEA